MDRYRYLQAMPNSPLTPLTPLSENTQFVFNFGGDGSLDEYIDSVLQEHRVEQQRKKLLQQANQSFQKKSRTPLPRRYSEEFLKIRDVFEGHNHQRKEENCNQNNKPQSPDATPKATVVKITYTGTTPTSARSKNHLVFDYANTPTNIRAPLKLKNNNNLPIGASVKNFNTQQQQKLQHRKQILRTQRSKQQRQMEQNRAFMKVSPVAAKPLCTQVANILQQCGLTMYNDIFQREEIDILAFRLLSLQDLRDLGIKNQGHCAILIDKIYKLYLLGSMFY